MRTPKVLAAFAAALIVSLVPTASSAAGVGSVVTPLLKVGPQALPAAIAGPNYGLFGCQVTGLNASATCYDPYQIRHAYNIDTLISAGLDGRGKTIVIVDAYQSPNIVQQLSFFSSFYGLPSLNGLGGAPDPSLGTFSQVAPDGLTPFVTGDPNMTGWAEEISLDVLWSHAIAPGANIVLVLAKSNNNDDILSATKYAVDHHLGDVISQSFGGNESCDDPTMLKQQHEVFADATRKNITLFASSGDEGATQVSCDGSSLVKAVSNPASDPLVTAVGGTELHAASYCLASLGCDPTVNPAPGTYEGEIVWNEPDYGSSGGGFSVVYDKPWYQWEAIDRGDGRGVPDVSYSAAVLHGVLTYLNIPGIPVGFYLFGGTSAGSPQWAAILAIADQRAGGALGFINTALYEIEESRRHDSSPFYDVTSGNNSFAGVTGFRAGPGWDAATGLGSPMADQIVRDLNRFVSSDDGRDEIGRGTQHPRGNSGERGEMKPH
jgi:subtilase family serine protease